MAESFVVETSDSLTKIDAGIILIASLVHITPRFNRTADSLSFESSLSCSDHPCIKEDDTPFHSHVCSLQTFCRDFIVIDLDL